MAPPLVPALSFDDVLATTKSVRKRLDLTRPVPREVVRECVQLANFAPSSRNTQPWHFVFVDDAEKRQKVAQVYAAAWDMVASPMYENEIANAVDEKARARVTQMAESSRYLRDHLAEVPVLLFPVVEGRAETFQSPLQQSLKWGSTIPATWSFMLAARSRGLGTSWTSLHLIKEAEVARAIGVEYAHYTQLAMIPLAYTLGTRFASPPRREVSQGVHFNGMTTDTAKHAHSNIDGR